MGEIVLSLFTGLIFTLTFLFLFLLIKPAYYPFKNKHEDVSRWKIFGIYCLIWVIYFILIIALVPDNLATQQPTNSTEPQPSMWGFLVGLVLGGMSFIFVLKRNNKQSKNSVSNRENHTQVNQNIVQPPPISKQDKLVYTENKSIHQAEKTNISKNGKYSILYEKENGEISTRFIDITLIYNQHKRWYVDAYCYQACDERTFRADRILELTNHQTGEHLTNQTAIRAYIRDLGKNGGY